MICSLSYSSVKPYYSSRTLCNAPKISSYLRQAPSTQTVELVKKFMLFTNDLDKTRGQNFRDIYEDMVRSLEENGFPWLNETLYA